MTDDTNQATPSATKDSEEEAAVTIAEQAAQADQPADATEAASETPSAEAAAPEAAETGLRLVVSSRGQKLAEYAAKQEPIPWVRVFKVPEFTYFPHKPHVRAGPRSRVPLSPGPPKRGAC